MTLVDLKFEAPARRKIDRQPRAEAISPQTIRRCAILGCAAFWTGVAALALF